MLRVGLTGSIAVGKSFVTGVLAGLGCHVLDADESARRVVEPGTAGLRAVVDAFGKDVLFDDGSLDRAKLGSIVFGDEKKRRLLNSILHPLIIAEQNDVLKEWENEEPRGIAIVDAALMIESGSYKRFDKIIVVFCRADVQLDRLMRRNSLSRVEAEKRILAQMPQDEKLLYADFSIDTSGEFEETSRRTQEVFTMLRAFAEDESYRVEN